MSDLPIISTLTAPPQEHSSPSASPSDSPSPTGKAREILAAQWPILGKALSTHQQNTAELFLQMAYDAIDAGLIRHDQRLRLAAAAEAMGLRPFDAQLLIACAIRQSALDRQYDSSPSLQAPALSFEYRSWRRACWRAAFFLAIAATLDVILLIKWLS